MYSQFKKVYQSASSLGKKETMLSFSNEEIQYRKLLIHDMEELRSQTELGWGNTEMSQKEALIFLLAQTY